VHFANSANCFPKGGVNPFAQRFGVITAGPDVLAFARHNGGRPGILAVWQHAFCRYLGVAQQLQGDVLIVTAGLRVVQDAGYLL
jgi:hypothetical protein